MGNDRRRATGRRGEQLAAIHLRRRGYTVLARNTRTRHGEIDVIAHDRHALVFVEVKTRCIGAHQRATRPDQLPLTGLSARQRARLRRLAAAWLADNASPPIAAHMIRFDAIGIVLDTRGRLRAIEHVEDAW
jgi:putative endonuclease